MSRCSTRTFSIRSKLSLLPLLRPSDSSVVCGRSPADHVEDAGRGANCRHALNRKAGRGTWSRPLSYLQLAEALDAGLRRRDRRGRHRCWSRRPPSRRQGPTAKNVSPASGNGMKAQACAALPGASLAAQILANDARRAPCPSNAFVRCACVGRTRRHSPSSGRYAGRCRSIRRCAQS